MKGLLGLIFSLICYASVATVVTLGVGFAYLWQKQALTRDKAIRILAMLHDIDLDGPAKGAEGGTAAINNLHISFDEMEKLRGVKSRELELQAQSVERGRDQILFERAQLSEDKIRHERIKNSFEEQLASQADKTKLDGISNVQQLLENVQPKQAKEQLLKMVENNEIEDVVVMLSDMNGSKRAKILKTFTSPEDIEILHRILGLIMNGDPENSLIKDTQEQLRNRAP